MIFFTYSPHNNNDLNMYAKFHANILCTKRLFEMSIVAEKWMHVIYNIQKEYTTSKVWGGKIDTLSLGVEEDISITLPRTSFKDIKVNYNVKNNVQAPIKKGDVLGSLEIVSKNEVVLTSDLIALNDVDAKGFFGRLWSKFILWIMSLFGMV